MSRFCLVQAVGLAMLAAGNASSGQVPESDTQQCGTVIFRVPPGWVRKDAVQNACTLVPNSGAHVGIMIFHGAPVANYRSAFETIVSKVGQRAGPNIETFPGPGYDILRATVRITAPDGKAAFMTLVSANPYGRIETIALSAESERDIGSYWATFEHLRKSLRYLPDSTPASATEPGSSPNSSIRNGIGAKYGTRDPHVCKSTKEPLTGPISAEQARQYFLCSGEREVGGYLYLLVS